MTLLGNNVYRVGIKNGPKFNISYKTSKLICHNSMKISLTKHRDVLYLNPSLALRGIKFKNESQKTRFRIYSYLVSFEQVVNRASVFLGVQATT
jgi:hypothetical protein